MANTRIIRGLFLVAALYDGILGILFSLMPDRLFHILGITPPNHFGYVQFPAALLIVFAYMFWNISRDPAKGRALIPYGILLKASYCIVVFGYWLASSIPAPWKPFAVCDFSFMLCFIWAYKNLASSACCNAA